MVNGPQETKTRKIWTYLCIAKNNKIEKKGRLPQVAEARDSLAQLQDASVVEKN